MTTTERPAELAERYACGRPAVTVFVTERLGEVGWCGISDGGAPKPAPARSMGEVARKANADNGLF